MPTPDNTILRTAFQGKNSEEVRKLITLIQDKGFVIRSTAMRGTQTSYETTMNEQELNEAITEVGASDVISLITSTD